MKRRAVSFLLFISLLISIIPMPTRALEYVSLTSVNEEIANLRSKLCTGSIKYWNCGYSKAKMRAIVDNGTLALSSPTNSQLGITTTMCVPGSCSSNAYDGIQCFGFARWVQYVLFGCAVSDNNSYFDTYTITSSNASSFALQPGDLLEVGTGNVHSAIVASVNGSSFECLEVWGSEKSGCRINYSTGGFNCYYNTLPKVLNKYPGYTVKVYRYKYVNSSSSYFTECSEIYPSYGTVEIGVACNLYSLPCNSDTAAEFGVESTPSGALKVGDNVTVTGIIENSEGNYWYRVSREGSSSPLWLYSRRVTEPMTKKYPSVSGSIVPDTISGSTWLSGTINAGGATITSVQALVYNTSGNVVLQSDKVSTNTSQYDLYKSNVDTSLKFQNVPEEGTHVLLINVDSINYNLTEDYELDTAKESSYKMYSTAGRDVFNFDKNADGSIGNPATTYTVTLYPMGAAESNSSFQVVSGNTVGELPTPTFSGMRFQGWYTEPYGGEKIESSYEVTGNLALYAHWDYVMPLMNFILTDGTVPDAVYTSYINGVNNGRPENALRVFNKSGSTVDTNYYGDEVAVNAVGKIVAVRGYKSEAQLTVPDGGFVLSGHGTSGMFVAKISGMEEAYVSLDYSTGEVKVFDSYAAYLVNSKRYMDAETYGVLPVPEREGYALRGWFSFSGLEANYYTEYSNSEIAARWEPEYNLTPTAECTYNDHVYQLFEHNVTWEQAKSLCEKMGGHLVTITDSGEQAAVVSLTSSGNRGSYHIGATDAAVEGTWTWVNGETFSYANWDTAYPEPSADEGENYSAIIAIDNPPNKQMGEWNDTQNVFYSSFHDISNTGFICEFDQSDLEKYTVTFDANGGVCTTSSVQVDKDTAIGVLPVPTRAGHAFLGWFSATSGGTRITEDTVITSSMKVYALWQETPYTVTYFDTSGTIWANEEAGGNWTLRTDYPQVDGSYFSGWVFAQGTRLYDVRPGETLEVIGDISLYPVYVTHAEAISGEPVLIYNIADFTDSSYEITTTNYARTREVDTSYWTDWTEYSTTPVTPSDTVEVRTMPLYRYYYYLCTGCGDQNPFSTKCGCGATSPYWNERWSTIAYSQSGYKTISYTTAKYYTEIFGDGLMWYFSAGNVNDTAIGTIDAGSTAVVISNGYSSRTYVEQYETETYYVTAYVITPCGHSYESVTIAPTCTERGYTIHTCTRCSDRYVDSYVEATGHSFGEWTIETEATCAVGGRERRDCANCDHYETRTTAATGNHTDAANDGDHSCDVCTAPNVTSHTGGAATCMAMAVCTECGEAYGEKNPQNHTGVNHTENAREATCTAEGYTGDTVCECGVKVADGTVIPVTEHDYVDGECADCGAEDPDWEEPSEPTDPSEPTVHEHTYETEVTPPTCTERGYTTYTCECGDTYRTDYVNALGHDWLEATCTEPDICSRCALTRGEPKGHNYVGGECTDCGEEDPNYEPEPDDPEEPSEPDEPAVLDGVIRLAGSNRYATGIAIADQLKACMGIDRFHTVVVAAGNKFPDALTGSYLAAVKNAPILLTDPKDTKVDQQVLNYLSENLVEGGQIYILGGTGAVSQTFEAGANHMGFDVKRLKGAGRYETNLEILKEAGVNTTDEILIATGKNYADSLSASATGLPMLLVNKTLTDFQKSFLMGTSKKFIILGGTGAVSEEIETELAQIGTVTRVKGSNRYLTSIAIAKKYFGDPQTVVLASGENFPDGLCGGPLAICLGAPLILTSNNSYSYADEYVSGVSSGAVTGGTGVIFDVTVRVIFDLPSNTPIVRP